MSQRAIPAVFMRGGTSKGVFFKAEDLPSPGPERDAVFSRVLGSPDPYGRQLDGMGGGISSLSKAVVIEASKRAGIDVDYTFAQVDVASQLVDYGATCGNLSSAVGPFAIDEDIIPADGAEALVRVYNTNTNKTYEARFPLTQGRAAVDGEFVIAGVAGSGAQIQLDFLDPGGARTGKLLPTGNVIDEIDVPDIGPIKATLVDATNPCVFVAAADLGLNGNELPVDIDGNSVLAGRLEHIRGDAGYRMGLAGSPVEASDKSKAAPKIAVVARPEAGPLIGGGDIPTADMDLSIRMISMGLCHKAVPLTGGMCAAVAARIEGGVVHQLMAKDAVGSRSIRLGTPSGIIPVGAVVEHEGGSWCCERVTVYRTARRLMEGRVLLPEATADNN